MAIKLSPPLARQFLEALYGRFFSQVQGAAYLEVRGKQEGQEMSFRRFFPSPEALLKDMPRWKPGLNYWVGVALRRDTKGGKKENLLALTVAFCDVDVGQAGHKVAPKYQSKDEALAAIEAFPLRPSLVAATGGGYQPYWHFRDPVELNQESIARLEGINRGLALALGGDVAATDAARILRLPGTFNMKLAGNPRPVEIVWCEPERVYDLADFGPYEGQGQKRGAQAGTPAPLSGDARPTKKGGPPEAGPIGEYEHYASKALADELASLARTPEGDRNNALNRSAHALGRLVGSRVLGRGTVEAALYGVALTIGLGEAEAQATIKSGLDSGISQPRALPEPAKKGGNNKRQGGSPASPGKGGPGLPGEPEAERIWWVGHCYFVERGRLCLENVDRRGAPYTVSLANFQARIEEEITRDDGLKKTKEFHLTGSLDTGQPLPPALVPAEKFDALAWIKREWGAAATVAPGRSLGPHLVNAIHAHSQGKTPKTPAFKRQTVFCHSGWRQIGGAWRYLHGGGAIGPGESVEVDLGDNLQLYRLPTPGGREAAQASWRFLDVAPWEVTAPLFAAVYLAPFADFLKIDFSIWIYGPTGAMKSTLAALALSHFGNFSRTTLPGSWFSTVNSLERLCFTLKDSLVVIDDFTPAASLARDFHHLSEKAGRLIYQAGNRSARGRLGPDLSARPNYYPRGLILSTGEVLLPGQRQSASARYLGVELDPKKTPIDRERLTAAQGEAEAGRYAGAMAAFLSDVAPRLEQAQEDMRELFLAYRGAFRNGGHARIPEIQAWLAVGFEFIMRFFVGLGAVSQEEADGGLNRAWQVWEALGEKHSRIIEGERPALKFLSILTELFLTSRVYCESKSHKSLPPSIAKEVLGWEGTEPAKNAFLVGYADESMVYLLPETALRVVSMALREQGDFLALGRNELWAALAREGIITPGAGGRTTRPVRIQGGLRRVICLPLEKLTPGEGGEEGV